VKNDRFFAVAAAGAGGHIVTQPRCAHDEALAVGAAQQILVARLQFGQGDVIDGSGEILAQIEVAVFPVERAQ